MPQSPTKYAKIKELRQDRVKMVADARKILEKAESEGRAMNAEEKGAWEEIMKKVDEAHERIDSLERMAEYDDADDEDREEEEDGEDEGRDEEDDEDEEDETEEDDSDRSGLKKYIIRNGKKYILQARRNGNRFVPAKRYGPQVGRVLPMRKMPWESPRDFESRKRRSTPEYREVFNHYLVDGEKALHSRLAQRAIQADSDIVGGYLVAPQEFIAKLIKFVNNYVFVRQKGTVYTVKSAQSLGAPSLDNDISDATWTSELDTGNEDTQMTFGKRELTPHPLAKRIKVSNKLLRLGNVASVASADGSGVTGGPESLVRDRLGYKFAVAEENAFLTGTGANQPLGMFTASTLGIDTSRDITTANAGTLVGDDLISAKYNQKIQYWPRLEWIFHRNVLQTIRKLKDSYGQYLWVPGGFGGEADTLLDIPVNMSEYAPSVISSGNYVGLLGDFSFYWIADSEQLEIQRLVELYAAANQTGFIARMELDGMPVLAEAFTRIKVQ
jgi:HK97 family phage major capsid protein